MTIPYVFVIDELAQPARQIDRQRERERERVGVQKCVSNDCHCVYDK